MIAEVAVVLGIESGNITAVCKGRRPNAGGFKWMYKENYDDLLEKKTD
jgi:hypothetical protein